MLSNVRIEPADDKPHAQEISEAKPAEPGPENNQEHYVHAHNEGQNDGDAAAAVPGEGAREALGCGDLDIGLEQRPVGSDQPFVQHGRQLFQWISKTLRLNTAKKKYSYSKEHFYVFMLRHGSIHRIRDM